VGANTYDGTGPTAEALSVVAADFTGDGNADLAFVVGWQASGEPDLSILPGNGDGTFGTAHTFTVTPASTSNTTVGVGDFYGDGVPAIALLTGVSPSYVSILADSIKTAPAVAVSAMGGS